MLSALFRSCACGSPRKPKATEITDGPPNESTRLLTGSLASTNAPNAQSLFESPRIEQTIPYGLDADLISEEEDSRSIFEGSLSTPPEPALRNTAAASPEIIPADVMGESETVDAWEAEAPSTLKTSIPESEGITTSPKDPAVLSMSPKAEVAVSRGAETVDEDTSAGATVAATEESSETRQQHDEGSTNGAIDTIDQVVARSDTGGAEGKADPVTEAVSPVEVHSTDSPMADGSVQKSKKGKNGKGKGKKTGKNREGTGRYRPR